MNDWLLPNATQDKQSVSSDWKLVGRKLIDGVIVKEVRSIVRATRTLTEIWRGDWSAVSQRVDQVFQVVLQPGSISAWHAHGSTTDQLFVASGQLHLILYDSRADSPTNGLLNEFHLSDHRPMLVVVPPRIWHGIINRAAEQAILLNATDSAYSYESPDHWRGTRSRVMN